jgi:hypothetical protein
MIMAVDEEIYSACLGMSTVTVLLLTLPKSRARLMKYIK